MYIKFTFHHVYLKQDIRTTVVLLPRDRMKMRFSLLVSDTDIFMGFVWEAQYSLRDLIITKPEKNCREKTQILNNLNFYITVVSR
jgi:hypothetical protein